MTLTIPKTGWYADVYEDDKHRLEYVGETIDHVIGWLDEVGYLTDVIAKWTADNCEYTVEELIAGIIDRVSSYLDCDSYINDWKDKMVSDGVDSILYAKKDYYHPYLFLTYYGKGDDIEESEKVEDIYEYDDDGEVILTQRIQEE